MRRMYEGMIIWVVADAAVLVVCSMLWSLEGAWILVAIYVQLICVRNK